VRSTVVTGLAILAIAVIPACGVVIGVKDLSVDGPGPGDPDAGSDPPPDHAHVDPPPTSTNDPDSGPDAPCAIQQIGPFTASQAKVSGEGLPWSGFNAGAFAHVDDNFANVSTCCGYSTSVTALLTGMAGAVPPTATITGFTVEVHARTGSGAGTFFDNEVRLLSKEGPSDDRGKPEAWNSSPAVRSYGGPRDTWGFANITAAGVNAPEFGVAFGVRVAQNDATAISVDMIDVIVHFCPGP
jgi:hypothetical protein